MALRPILIVAGLFALFAVSTVGADSPGDIETNAPVCTYEGNFLVDYGFGPIQAGAAGMGVKVYTDNSGTCVHIEGVPFYVVVHT